MEKLKYFIIVAILVSVSFLIGLLVLDKKLQDDPTFLDDYIDTTEIFDNSSKTKNDSLNMKVESKDVKVKGNSDYVENPEYSGVTGNSGNNDYSEIVVKSNLTKEDWTNRIDNGINSENLKKKDRECKDLYYYEQLDSFEKQLYLEILISFENQASLIPLCSVDAKEIDFAFNCVLADHPEVFYVDGYLITRYSVNDEIARIDFSPAFTMSFQERQEAMTYVDAYVKAYLEGLPNNASEYDKIKYTYEIIILNTEYKVESKENQNILSVFIYGESVCNGYAKAFQYLTSKVGIKSTLVVGTVGEGDGHAWNLVECNDEYYYVDCTWGDSSYMKEVQGDENNNTINYDYLNITSSEIMKTHTFDNFTSVPICTATKNNYYVKEGMYFIALDETQLKSVFNNAINSGAGSVELKCANGSVYDQIGRYLLDDQNVFLYLPSNTEKMTVYKNKDMLIYSFPLH